MDGTDLLPTEDGLIHAEGSGCVPYEEQQNCQISDPDPAGELVCMIMARLNFSDQMRSNGSTASKEQPHRLTEVLLIVVLYFDRYLIKL
ncbi:unnamed protein product [Anisakis simplex]|uniref:Uncharacterized protein n=1 Tax=Anisakis simplex TaxID=6269 RepID=A0A0M3KEI9_ANISI|nr:unnamed protein product [Anisakis simplex]